MDTDSLTYLDKAIESLAGAESEYANKRYNNCANRCYYRLRDRNHQRKGSRTRSG